MRALELLGSGVHLPEPDLAVVASRHQNLRIGTTRFEMVKILVPRVDMDDSNLTLTNQNLVGFLYILCMVSY